MPLNATRTILRVNPTEKNCTKRRPTASIPLEVLPLIEAGILKRIEIYDSVENRFYIFEAKVAVKYFDDPYFNALYPPRYKVFPYKRAPRLKESPHSGNVKIELTDKEAKFLRDILNKMETV